MTKGEAKKQALRWLDEATLNGQTAGIELTADYTDKFDCFLWNVLVFIAAIFKIEKRMKADAETGEKKGGYYSFKMPEDFMELERINMYTADTVTQLYGYIKESDNTFLIPKSVIDNEDIAVEFIYYAMPKEISYDAPDSTELEILPKAIQLVPLRLAIEATAGSDETNAISAYLEGKFSSMVNTLLGDEAGAFNITVERVYAQ